MFKIISSEEYEKLIGDVDYWKARALEEEKIKQIYKIRHINKVSNNKRYDVKLIELKIENQELKRKIKELEKEKVTFISFKGIKALNEAEILAEKVRKALNNEHHCDKNCFAEHVLSAIQSDYESTSKKLDFISYWYEKLSKEYHWLKCLYVNDGKIYFK